MLRSRRDPVARVMAEATPGGPPTPVLGNHTVQKEQLRVLRKHRTGQAPAGHALGLATPDSVLSPGFPGLTKTELSALVRSRSTDNLPGMEGDKGPVLRLLPARAMRDLLAQGSAAPADNDGMFRDWLDEFRVRAQLSAAAEDKGSVDDTTKLWEILSEYQPRTVEAIQKQIVTHIEYTLARSRFTIDHHSAYMATAYSVRDRLLEYFNDTQQYFNEVFPKRVYYLSIEYLLGRTLANALTSLNISGVYRESLRELGFVLEDLYNQEQDAALGNGGLGRLAACYLDSAAALDLPLWGYGLRYNYGMFTQSIIEEKQSEFPDFWLSRGFPWEIERLDVVYAVNMYGFVRKATPAELEDGYKGKFVWEPDMEVLAVAYDLPIPGYKTNTTLNLRLWQSKPSHDFDLMSFNRGNYTAAIALRQECENITSVLYPDDSTPQGRELRLKQQYFFASASLQDIVRRYRKSGRSLLEFGQYNAIQINDTHPAVAIPELMRILLDEEGLPWGEAWAVCVQTFAYTNHTVLPEALETWPVPVMEKLLPRIMQIIFDINCTFLSCVRKRFPGDESRVERVSIIAEGHTQLVRMAHLGIVGSHAVNAVARLHGEIIQDRLFRDFYEMFPKRFTYVTNGVTPRRWLLECNPYLSHVITDTLGSEDWTKDIEQLCRLKDHATSRKLQQQWLMAKRLAKERLILFLKTTQLKDDPNPPTLDPNAMFVVHIKRIHEYKRQLMNILQVLLRYLRLKDYAELVTGTESIPHVVPRVIIFAGKAAPAYTRAKEIIQLIVSAARLINNDPVTRNSLVVFFVADYNVSKAEILIPAADISEHISTAGMEASGTSNMKFALNGANIIGTYDGANIEIAEEVGKEKLFMFGANAKEVEDVRAAYARGEAETIPTDLDRVISFIESGALLSKEERARGITGAGAYRAICDEMRSGTDYWLVAHDFQSYIKAQAQADRAFANPKAWTENSINLTGGMAHFSSDRSVKEYADRIWKVKPCPVPGQTGSIEEEEEEEEEE
ncbi:glycogen/starch/alpha-glucan phosphorylase [Kipferlia bialata]|uniref:Alpha-1,4 glucan phosphorylase n=1 Tax=Kipferlia bialata TaxID=797122 RepID=A0A9K3CS89_9EUKA|nr:glycogen/starch/alpha-glucan phosphorylase [Kipferlia bialata]|eukprot:g3294.t1